jgi:hypothetical protein
MMHIILISITIIVMYIYYYYYYFQESGEPEQQTDIEECTQIYKVTPKYRQTAIIENLLTDEECDEIIRTGISYGNVHKWTTQRHEHYPTTDNQMTTEWPCYKWLEQRVFKIVFEKYRELYDVNINLLSIEELFLSKYDGNDPTKQDSLEVHTDGNEFSFVLALNDNYEGGGTYFKDNGETVKLKKGDCLVFCGQREHAGIKVTNGIRYIVAGFVVYDKCDCFREE